MSETLSFMLTIIANNLKPSIHEKNTYIHCFIKLLTCYTGNTRPKKENAEKGSGKW